MHMNCITWPQNPSPPLDMKAERAETPRDTHGSPDARSQLTHNAALATLYPTLFMNTTVSLALPLPLKLYSWLHENNRESIFITACPFQMQSHFPPFKACLWWDKSEHTGTEKKKKKKPSPICAHFRLNMNWLVSPPVEAFLVSAGPGYLIWTWAFGSSEFIQ